MVTTTSSTASYSSFIRNISQDTSPHDFSGVAKNDILTIKIPSDEDGNSGFELDWKDGDVLVFKDFGEDGVTVPDLPLSTWVLRAVIQPWESNKFKDTSDDVITGGNFDVGSTTSVDGWGFNWGSYDQTQA